MLDAKHVSASLRDLLVPTAPVWDEATGTAIPLTPTPLDQQPSAYIQTAWADRDYGVVSEVLVQALVSEEVLALRLGWTCSHPNRLINDINVYADACAVLFPANVEHADLNTMGSPENPVFAWHWRAGSDQAFSVMAKGIGSVERATEHEVQSRSLWNDGRWQVVLARPLNANDISLSRAATLPMAFAVWSGAGSERAGLKSHSPEYCHIRLN